MADRPGNRVLQFLSDRPWLWRLAKRISPFTMPIARLVSPTVRKMEAYVREAATRRVGWEEVRTHLLALGVTEDEVAMLKSAYIGLLHAQRQ